MTDSPDRRLWLAVLAAALHDVAKGGEVDYLASRDFHMVCALAGADPDAVRDRFDADAYRRASRAA